MDDMHLNEEQSAILQQYKEILNESDDDMARATLESLGWDLAKAIEASSVTDNCATTGSKTPGVVDLTGGEDAFPQYERMDTHDASVQIIDEPNHDHDLLFARLNAKVKMENEDPMKPNRGAAQADELSLDCYITSDSSNGLHRKTSGERVDSGSGSVCSLSNPAQASTSATADVVVIGGSSAGPSSMADKNSRKEKKRCKMSGSDNKEEVSVTFESEESDQDDVEDMDDSIVYLTDEDTKKEDSPNVSFNDQIP
uniref:Uncharacterized protein n=1 Tax=Ditylenchus dipsaci TaxID=166011 RepID=A0A915DKT4_9BILA